MTHLLSATLTPPADATGYPFQVPAVRATTRLEFPTPVTFFVGENGSGKSTLLEGLAAACRLPTVGSAEVAVDDSLTAARRLGAAFRLGWRKRAHRGFFLRAEDFFGFLKSVAQQQAELRRDLERIEIEYADASPLAQALARGPAASSLAALRGRYGEDPDVRSHGESFLDLFKARFVPDGLHLLDEPEAPLSPTSQLALLAMLQQMVGEGAQFIIATHSPILLAYPGATILSFDERPPRPIAWDEVEHVRVTRDFLAAPERFLRHLVD